VTPPLSEKRIAAGLADAGEAAGAGVAAAASAAGRSA